MIATLFAARKISRFWCEAKDGDAQCRDIFDRHYSRRRYADGRKPKLFIGPGEKRPLITPEGDAVFFWRKFIDDAIPKQTGVNCAAFRNESQHLSSEMIRDADALADQWWPGERHYTYVDADEIKSSNPGFCFLAAGWKRCGKTKGGLVILERQFTVPRERVAQQLREAV